MSTKSADSIKNPRLRWMLALVLNLSLLSACTPGAIEPTPVGRAAPVASATELADLVEGNTAFAFDLYQALGPEGDGNVVYSPYTLSLALAMAYAGARGETERQMAGTLHLSLPQAQLHPASTLSIKSWRSVDRARAAPMGRASG
jgi:serpin B